MPDVDIAILVLVAIFGVLGFLQGFIVGALSMGGLAVGAILGTRIAPMLLEGGNESPYTPLIGLGAGLLLATVLSTTLQGVGLAVRSKVRVAEGIALDRFLGALLSACVALLLTWILAAMLMAVPQARALRTYVVRSQVVETLNSLLPPSGPILNTLARYDPFPAFAGPRILLDAPPGDIPRDPQVRAAAASVVRVVGEACGFGVTGSGWIVEEGRVVTNAHVVAGQRATFVQVGGRGAQLPTRVVAFDGVNDVAVLDVPSLDGRALRFASAPRRNDPGAVLGYPESGPFDVRPARLGDEDRVGARDITDSRRITRSVTSFRALVRHGNSGGPIVNDNGRVLTTVFAASVGGDRGGYGVPNDVVREVVADAGRRRVSTGDCVG